MSKDNAVSKPLVGVVMGSSSDWDVMQHAVAILKEFGIPHEAQVVSAHRMPDQMLRLPHQWLKIGKPLSVHQLM